MAAPPPITRALAVRLIRRIEDELYPAAAAAGHPAGPPFRYGDGMTRAEAGAFRQWTMNIPELRRAMLDRGGWQDEAQAITRLVTYFEAEHPQAATGEPSAWTEPLSPAMRGFAMRGRHELPAGELLPQELEAMLEYARVRHEPADQDIATGERLRLEADELVAAAEKALETARAAPSEEGQDVEGKGPIDPKVLAAEIRGLGAWQKAAYFAEKFGPPEAQKAAAPESVIAPTVKLAAPPAAAQSNPARPAVVDPAALRAELKGMTGAQRRATLDARFGSGIIGTPAEGPNHPTATLPPGRVTGELRDS
jgi:hypothetical protein